MERIKLTQIFSVILSISAFLLMSCNGGSGSAFPAIVTVDIPASASGLGAAAYGTNPLSVKIGTLVKWKNNDSMAHTATSDATPAKWDSGSIAPGGTYSYQFNELGTYNYHCTIHGALAMSGTIQVTP